MYKFRQFRPVDPRLGIRCHPKGIITLICGLLISSFVCFPFTGCIFLFPSLHSAENTASGLWRYIHWGTNSVSIENVSLEWVIHLQLQRNKEKNEALLHKRFISSIHMLKGLWFVSYQKPSYSIWLEVFGGFIKAYPENWFIFCI